jgi:hypothetical protein
MKDKTDLFPVALPHNVTKAANANNYLFHFPIALQLYHFDRTLRMESKIGVHSKKTLIKHHNGAIIGLKAAPILVKSLGLSFYSPKNFTRWTQHF